MEVPSGHFRVIAATLVLLFVFVMTTQLLDRGYDIAAAVGGAGAAGIAAAEVLRRILDGGDPPTGGPSRLMKP